MNSVAIVAGGRDAQFAEQLRTLLLAAGREAQIQTRLPADPSSPVILLWSAALESEHAIDAQALIGLWSENRLVAVRRDETPLPLGLRDLPSLDASKSPAAVVAALPVAEQMKSVETAQAGPKRSAAPAWAAGLAVVIAVAGMGWYYFNRENLERQGTLTAALESATKAAEELKAAQTRQLDALKALEQAREAEAKARVAGDVAALKTAQEQVQRAEEEAKKQAALVKAQEQTAVIAREEIKKSQDAAKQAKAEPTKQETVAAAAPKAEAPAPKAEAQAPKAVAKAQIEPSKMSRSQRERLADEEAARKALEKAGKAPSTQPEVASAGPAAPTAVATPSTSESAAPKAATEPATLYEQALAMENDGNAKDAIRIYRRAARAGSGKAAKRLGEIFDRGVPGVPRDYAESLQWYETARQLGESIEVARRGGAPSSPAPAPKAVQTPKPAPVPAPVAAPEPAKAVEPAPTTAPTPVAAAPEAAPERHKPSWWRFLLIPAFVLAIIYWRRSRKRHKRAMKASQLAASPMPAAPVQMRAAPAPADASMLFVSYSHKDRVRVEPIVSAIEQMGRRVWMDRTDITGQTGWAGQIVRAIRDCRAVVLMASPNAYGSDQVVRELYLAMNHKKAIVPIEIEPAELPDELQYILAPFQHHRLSGGETRAVLGRALAAI